MNIHYIDVIMTTVASQITSFTVVYSTVYSDADQRKHQSSASLAFVRGIHRDRWIPRTKGQLRGKCFHLMTSSWITIIMVIITTTNMHRNGGVVRMTALTVNGDVEDKLQSPHPLNTWRNKKVIITSKRRHFNVITSKWRRFDLITTSLLRKCVYWAVTTRTVNLMTFLFLCNDSYLIMVAIDKYHHQCSLSLVVISGTTGFASRLGTNGLAKQ